MVVINEVFVMKVVLPITGLCHTSKDIMPASCISKPQISCTSVPKVKVNEGLSNQEIYEGIVSIKERISSLFNGSNKKPAHPVNYLI